MIKIDISEEAKLHVPWGYAKEPQNVLLKFLVGALVRENSGEMHAPLTIQTIDKRRTYQTVTLMKMHY